MKVTKRINGQAVHDEEVILAIPAIRPMPQPNGKPPNEAKPQANTSAADLLWSRSMTDRQKRSLMAKYRRYLQDRFLPNEEVYFNQLSLAFANFLDMPVGKADSIPFTRRAVMEGYAAYVRLLLDGRIAARKITGDDLQSEMNYYIWPVACFIVDSKREW